MSHVFINFTYHIVFSTKCREPLLTDDIRERVFEYLGGILRERGHCSIIINGMSDHVHILAKIRQDRPFADVVREMKAISSGWIHRTFPNGQDFSWQRGYGAFTVSESQVERVRAYIANQQIHHRKQSFAEEFPALLKANNVEFDERHLWS
jgi:putative transposase